MAAVRLVLVAVCIATVYAKICEKPIPNLDWISLGVDISNVDLHPTDGGTPKGSRARVVEYTCNKGRKRSIEGQEYDLPDQIDRVDVTAQGGLSTSKASTRTLNKFKDNMGIEVGIKGTFPKGSFSLSTTYTQARERMTESQVILSTTNAAQSTWVVRHKPPIIMTKYVSSSFAADLSALPDKYESSPSQYFNFVKTYGTHYINSGTFGGAYYFQFESKETLGSMQDENSISINAEAEALNILKVKGAYSESKKQVAEEFLNLTTVSQRFYGGEVNLLEQDGFHKWWPTVKFNPSMQNCQLKPITDLVRNATRKSELEKAVKAHLTSRYLENDLKNVLEHYLSSDIQYEKINKHLNTIAALSSKSPIAELSNLQDAAGEISKYALTPDWLFEVSQVCVKFIPAEAIGCSLSGKICVKPNQPIIGFLNHVQHCVDGFSVEFENARIPTGWDNFAIKIFYTGQDYIEYQYDMGSQYLWFRHIQLCFYGTPSSAIESNKNNMKDRSYRKCTKYAKGKQKLLFNDILVKSIVMETAF